MRLNVNGAIWCETAQVDSKLNNRNIVVSKNLNIF